MRVTRGFFNTNKQAMPTVFPLSGPFFREVMVSHHLSSLSLGCFGVERPFLLSLQGSLLRDAHRLSFDIKSTVKENQLFFYGFSDVDITLKLLTDKINRVDSQFFSDLHTLQVGAEEEENQDKINTNLARLLNSPEKVNYFYHRAYSEEGIQHTMEILLKAMKTQDVITPEEYLKVVEHLWLKTSADRKNYNQMVKVATQCEQDEKLNAFLPFAFRPGM